MGIDKERFRRMFPHLAKEMDNGKSEIRFTAVRTDVSLGEKAVSDKFTGYNPDVIDFLRRCETNDQALEIINYCERRGEITSEYARQLRDQLKARGVRSFGSKKEEDYYFKHGIYG
ncbi:DUF2095 family protein [Candidatus Bathyarchaeota archaeon]|nr:DUF2095 family protein [Candidatus Bathyarchaeota archaeon]